jgi:undecaprenyl-diphosphatase
LSAYARIARVARIFPRGTWLRLLVGFALAFAAGAAVAIDVQRSGGWAAGTRWDIATMHRVHTSLPPWLDFILVSVPWLGTNITIIAVLIPLGVWLARRGRSDIVAELSAAIVGSYLLNLLIKLAFGRARPALWPRRGEYTWASYPSGHAIAMISVLLFAAWLLHRERGWLWPYWLWLPAFVATIYSRMYLGVHWPTDVVGGVAIGMVWLLTVWLTFRRAGAVQVHRTHA